MMGPSLSKAVLACICHSVSRYGSTFAPELWSLVSRGGLGHLGHLFVFGALRLSVVQGQRLYWQLHM